MIDFVFVKCFSVSAIILFYTPHVGCRKNWFYAGCDSGNYCAASCRRNGEYGGVPDAVFANLVSEALGQILDKFTFAVAVPVKIWEDVLFTGEISAGFIRRISEHAHNLVNGFQRIFAVILCSHFHQHITEPENSETDTPVIFSISLLRFQRMPIEVVINHVIKKTCSELHTFLEFVNHKISFFIHETFKIYGSEVAAAAVGQWLFCAGIGGNQWTAVFRIVVFFHRVPVQ